MDQDCLRQIAESLGYFLANLIDSLFPSHEREPPSSSSEEEGTPLEDIATRAELDQYLAQVSDEDERGILEMDWYEMQWRQGQNMSA